VLLSFADREQVMAGVQPVDGEPAERREAAAVVGGVRPLDVEHADESAEEHGVAGEQRPAAVPLQQVGRRPPGVAGGVDARDERVRRLETPGLLDRPPASVVRKDVVPGVRAVALGRPQAQLLVGALGEQAELARVPHDLRAGRRGQRPRPAGVVGVRVREEKQADVPRVERERSDVVHDPLAVQPPRRRPRAGGRTRSRPGTRGSRAGARSRAGRWPPGGCRGRA
jgi:hypothetical protein